MRKWLVLTDGYLIERNAKTAHGVLRYARDDVVAVLDREHAGKRLEGVMPDLRRAAPIVATVREGIELGATSLLLGVATPGGWMPEHWRPWIVEAIEAGMEIANGLHRFLGDDVELVELAARHGATLWDVRQPPDDIPLFSGKHLDKPAHVVGVVGSDCAVGKMTVALELDDAGREAGVATEFVATGQTGILIAGKGIAVDRVISDFVAGAAEALVGDTDPSSDVLLIEGQGSLWHPAYSAVTLGLLHGSAPHSLVFCHQAGRTAIEEPPYTKLPPLDEMIEVYERTASTVRPARVTCVAVTCAGLSPDEAAAAIVQVEAETGLPAGDVFRGDAPRLWEAVASAVT
ncbi:MAG TPA: DUF1611 domain-containing protein [Actinomycetota bacterium]|jgi:uncharacterized NAD-dependent epimerase/dehydratase family protein